MATVRDTFFVYINIYVSDYFMYYGGGGEDFDFEDETQKKKYKELIKKLKNFYVSSYKKEKQQFEESMKYRLEYVDMFTPPEQVQQVINRNVEKFDSLTSRGYKLNFLTGEFKLSS
jgi:hypothetical protein